MNSKDSNLLTNENQKWDQHTQNLGCKQDIDKKVIYNVRRTGG